MQIMLSDRFKEAPMDSIRIAGILLMLLLTSVVPAAAQGPSLTIVSPAEGATIGGASVTVEFKVTDLKIVPSTVLVAEFGRRPETNRPDEGHLHLSLDLFPLVIWERASPYVFKDVPLGEHLLKVELANNDHSSRTPPVIKEIRFKTGVAPNVMPKTGVASHSEAVHSLLLLGLLLLAGGYLSRRLSWPNLCR
jgi:hypothetical protein